MSSSLATDYQRREGILKPLIILALLLGATGVTLGVVNLVSDDEESDSRTLTLTGREGSFSFNDVPPRAKDEGDIAAGDSFTFSNDVSGDAKGELYGGCFVADKGKATCQATYELQNGRITIAGVPGFSQEPETFEVAVTGGLGAYEGATGRVAVKENGQATHVMSLQLPGDG
jgi:hypothetical protein